MEPKEAGAYGSAPSPKKLPRLDSNQRQDG
jgi:hypothetical protein